MVTHVIRFRARKRLCTNLERNLESVFISIQNFQECTVSYFSNSGCVNGCLRHLDWIVLGDVYVNICSLRSLRDCICLLLNSPRWELIHVYVTRGFVLKPRYLWCVVQILQHRHFGFSKHRDAKFVFMCKSPENFGKISSENICGAKNPRKSHD